MLIAAGPGTGKSAFALTLALRSRAPCLYFSADSDAFEQLSRSISVITQCPLSKAKQTVLHDHLDTVADNIRGVPIRLNYDASPSLDTIQNSINSWVEVYDEYPALIIVDNVTNVRAEGYQDEDPFSGLEGLMDYLSTMARGTGACVVGLHHVTGEHNNGNRPIPMNGVKGQITRVPSMVLTLFRPSEDSLGVSAVKNRGGKQDATGQSYAELEFDGDTMQISDPQLSAPDTSIIDADAERRRREMEAIQ